MKKLTVALATRSRPQVMVETVRQMVANSDLPNTTIVVLMDEDDPASFEALKAAGVGSKVVWSVEPREDTLGEKYNRVLSVEPADLYQVAVDYAPILTPGYDKRLLEAASVFPDGIGVVYGPPANASFPTTQAPTARWVELFGGIYPGWFPYWFVDHWMDDVVKMVGRISAAEISVDCHSRRQPSTLELRDVDFWATFFDAGRTLRRKQAEKILAALDQPEWMKQLARSQWHRVEARSLWINHTVRHDKAAIEGSRGGTPPDARYARVFHTANDLLSTWLHEFEQTMTIVPSDHPQQNPQEFSWLLQRIRGARSILEIGSCHGSSLKMLAEHAAPGAKVRSIDFGTQPGAKRNLSEVVDKLKLNGYDAEVRFGNSQEVEQVEWARGEGPFDVVFIDGEHSYKGASKDYQSYGQLGKIVVLHDIAHPGYQIGKLWGEIKSSGKPTVERVLSDMGIGVVFNVQ